MLATIHIMHSNKPHTPSLHVAFGTSVLKQRRFSYSDTQLMINHNDWALYPHLLFVVGCVRQQGRHMKHDLIVLVCCVQGVSACGIRCRKNSNTMLRTTVQLLQSISLTRVFCVLCVSCARQDAISL